MNTELTHLSLIHVKRACLIQINENVVRWLTFKITAKNRKSKDSYHKRWQIGREQNRHASRQPKAKQQHQRAAADRLGIGLIRDGGQGKSGDGGECVAELHFMRVPFMRRHDDGRTKNLRFHSMQTYPRQPCGHRKRSKKIGKQKKRPKSIR